MNSFADSNSAPVAIRPVNMQIARDDGPQSVHEQRHVAQHRPEEARGRHAELGLTRHHRQVGGQRQFQPQPQRVRLHLDDRGFRKSDELVEHSLALAVHGQPPSLAGPAVVTGSVVPAVGAVEVDTGGEDAAFATHQHHFDGVVLGDVVEVAAHQLAVLGRHRVLLGRVADGDPGDVRLVVLGQGHPLCIVVGACVISVHSFGSVKKVLAMTSRESTRSITSSAPPPIDSSLESRKKREVQVSAM